LAFNLVPAFPLDGGRVLRSILWGALGNLRRATYWAALAGRGFAALLIALGVLCLFSGQVFQGVWLGLIGLFLSDAARGGYEQVLVRQVLRGEPVSRFMTADPVVVPPSLDLRSWVEDYVYRHHRKAFPVVSDGRLEGLITTAALADFPREDWPLHKVAEAMQRDLSAVSIVSDTDALAALGKMQGTGSSRLLVVDGGRLVGIVSLKDLLRFLHLKLELEDDAEGPGGRPQMASRPRPYALTPPGERSPATGP
jgi:CBS domain-containing protein